MLSDERLAHLKAWFNDPLRASLIPVAARNHANDLLADAESARALLREALAYQREREWKVASHIGGPEAPYYWCDECAYLRTDGHGVACAKAAHIAKLEAAVPQA